MRPGVAGLTFYQTGKKSRSVLVKRICGRQNKCNFKLEIHRGVVKSLRKKEKMLVTSIFSFFHNVFKRLLFQGRQKSVLCGKAINHHGPYLPTILKTVLPLVPQIFLCLETLECTCNRNSDRLNRMFQPIRSCVTFKCTNLDEKRQMMFLRMVGQFGPNISKIAFQGLIVIVTRLNLLSLRKKRQLFVRLSFITLLVPPGWLSGERFGLMTRWLW